ncbi:recombinase family protein [Algoriella sp.]|uniref:recombinase family protein n=1 Tax=Algoriella sp. TaxID=1872434 RepID=UPI001B113ADE|nr:recombinase family protein [Algoriella sp.]MBO6212986.1 recombinase family protein [Algoriella sp.]
MLGIYVRVSNDDDEIDASKSIINQTKFGQDFATKNKLIDYKIYVDDGVSGTSKNVRKRKGFNALINDIEAGIITTIWANSQDRFERSQATRIFLKELVKTHNLSVYIGDILQDFGDANSVLMGDLLSIFNEFQAIQTSQKINKVRKQYIADGKVVGYLKYGFMSDKKTKKIIIDEGKRKVIELIFFEFSNGKGSRAIANLLNDKNLPSAQGKKWNPTAVWRILKNPIYAGHRVFEDVIYKDNVPAIVPQDVFDMTQEILSSNKSNLKKGKFVDNKYLLKGMIKCGVCGKSYYGRSGATARSNYYFCHSTHDVQLSSCGNKSIVHHYLDEMVFQITYLLTMNQTSEKTIKHLQSEIDAHDEVREFNEGKVKNLLNERSNLIKAIAKGLVTDADVINEQRRISMLVKELELHNSELYKLQNNLKKTIKNHSSRNKLNDFKTYSNLDKRNLLESVIRSIEVVKRNDKTRQIIIHYYATLDVYLDLNIYFRTFNTNTLYIGFSENDLIRLAKFEFDLTLEPKFAQLRDVFQNDGFPKHSDVDYNYIKTSY